MSDSLNEAIAGLAAARERVESIIAAHPDGLSSPGDPFDSPLRAQWKSLLAMQQVRAEEAAAARAVEATQPSTADQFAETFEHALRASRTTSDLFSNPADE